MKAYRDLSDAGKLRRLRELAHKALTHYDLKSPVVSYHSFSTNLLYRVKTISGERFMLRLAAPGWRTFDDLQSEALWLNALVCDTTIPVPRILPALSGEYVLPISQPDIPNVWNATLMSWVPGRLLGHYLSERNLEKMGELFAVLNNHGAAWIPPEGFTTRRFEHWLSRGEENLIISSERSATSVPQSESLAALTPRSRDVLDRMNSHVEQAYAAANRSDLRVIHCDLWHDNIKLYQGRLHPFDFEDTVWGFRAHDIAMAMLDLLEVTDDVRYSILLAAFRRGYEAHMTWPDDPIEPFQIGRLLWMINWVARNERQSLARMVERYVPVFDHYEQTGKILSLGNPLSLVP
jgi:Ser/Thr protein kinase RdoA (MazF antagonist)